jgi:molecular chaperone DnaJ
MLGVPGKTYYDVLGVTKDASADEIKHAFRKLASQCHPDKNPGDKNAELRFKELNEAYQTLGDDTKRKIYDFDQRMAGTQVNIGHTVRPTNPQDLQDLMQDLFVDLDFAPFQTPRRKPTTQEVFQKDAPGDAVLMDLTITLEESIAGCKKPITVKGPRPNVKCGNCGGIGTRPGTRRIQCSVCAGHGKQYNLNGRGNRICQMCAGTGTLPLERCNACGGNGKVIYTKDIVVQVPAGIAEGQQLRLAGQGTPGHPPGDLLITIKVAASRQFWREGNDVHTTKRVSLRHAITGGPVIFTGPDGQTVSAQIPEGTQPGEIIRISGAGVAGPLSKARGDLMVHVEVMLPRQLSPRAKKLLDEFMEELSRGPQGYT